MYQPYKRHVVWSKWYEDDAIRAETCRRDLVETYIYVSNYIICIICNIEDIIEMRNGS
jgi:hypothetical protein